MTLIDAIILTCTAVVWYFALLFFTERFERADIITDLFHFFNARK